MEQSDKRAVGALEQELKHTVGDTRRSYYVNGERHTGPHQRYYHRWVHELKKK